MRTVTVADAQNVIFGLQDEIRRSQEARYDHRLHGVLLVAQGMNCCQVAELLGDAPRTVAYWVEKFEQKGLAGLQEGARSGRPSKLDADQLADLQWVLRGKPRDVGLLPIRIIRRHGKQSGRRRSEACPGSCRLFWPSGSTGFGNGSSRRARARLPSGGLSGRALAPSLGLLRRVRGCGRQSRRPLPARAPPQSRSPCPSRGAEVERAKAWAARRGCS